MVDATTVESVADFANTKEFKFLKGAQNPPGWSSEKSKNRNTSVDVAVLDLEALSDSVPELEEIDKRFAAAPDRGFRGRAFHEYWIIQRLVKTHVDLNVARILDFGCGVGIAATSFALRHPGATVFGTDVLEPDMERVRRECYEQTGLSLPENLSLFWSETGSLPDQVCDMDLIYAWSVFEHVNFTQIADTMRLIRSRLRANGIVLLQSNPLYFSPKGSHLYRYDPTPWTHLLNQSDVLKDKVMRSAHPESRRIREWEEFEALNRATADDIKEAAQQAGFSLLFEERLRTTETPPPRLLRVYHREVLETEELRLLLT
jgi:2-polyprenyl-3-methyl-5-hydroxy-6-metoxy-1,4-benzoquinol methylase